MNIAYLLLCHKNLNQVESMVDSLNDENSDFYIHIDKKVGEFSRINGSNVCYLADEERVDIKWASFNMVRATLLLIKKCLDSNKSYDYIILLSGQDFPIKSNKEIQSFLEENKSLNYIEVLNDNLSDRCKFEKRNELFYPQWMLNRKTIIKCIRQLYILFTGGDNHTFKIFKKKIPCGLKMYYGSQWWALRRECLQWIMELLSDHPEIITFFSSSIVADESFFQTLFMASPYADLRKGKIVFVEWETGGSHPKIIDERTALKLRDNSQYLYARKFDLEINKKAINIVKTAIKNV